MSLHEIALAINESPFSTALRESQYAFPLVEGVHLLGLALSFGLLLLIDLRLIGWVLRGIPAGQLLHQLRTLLFAGFAATFISGGLLLWAEAESMVDNPAFLFKLGFMLIACVNALLFEVKFGAKTDQWTGQVPAAAKLAGWVSLSFWTLSTITGRLIPYVSSNT